MVATAHPLASQAGVEMLRRGGNAVDAAVAAAFTIGVAEPFCSGIGGGGFLLLRLSRTGETTFIDYREVAPRRAAADMYPMRGGEVVGRANQLGHRAVAVPGSVAGLCLALEQFGRLSLAEVLAPAIRAAEEGIIVTQNFRNNAQSQHEKLRAFPEIARIYLKRNGDLLDVGDTLRNPDYGRTLRLVAAHGPDVFYRGEVARAIADEIGAGGGILDEEDLAAYRPTVRTPIAGTYRGYDLIATCPPSSGGAHVIEILNMLEQFDIGAMGHNSVRHLHLLAEVQKRAFRDRDAFMGDPGFVRDIPLKGLTTKGYAAERVREIDPAAATPPGGVGPGRPRLHEGNSTTHLSVMDEELNMVALTQTIECFFGSGIVVPGYGFILNDEMHDLDPKPGGPNSIAPGKKPLSSMSPTLVLKDGRPVMTVGSPGSKRIITAVAQVISNVIDHGMRLQDAIAAPRVHIDGDVLNVEGRVPAVVAEGLKALGHEVNVRKEYDLFFGGSQGVLFDGAGGLFYGGADPRRDGVALGFDRQ